MRPEFMGLGYADRFGLCLDRGATLTVHVPLGDPPAGFIAPRSGVVGEPYDVAQGALTFVHYEGWLHGAYQYESLAPRQRWEAAVLTAAGRAFVAYPTIARGVVRTDALHPVGTVRAALSSDRTALTITDEEAVRAWLL
jgi:hypothetical protein